MKSVLFQRGTAVALLSLALTACGTQQASVPGTQAQAPAQSGALSALSLDTASPENETPQLWFVEFASAPTADGGNLSDTENDKRNFRAEAKQKGLKYTERRAFGKLFNGLSVQVAPGELAKLSRLGSVKAIYPVESIKIPETEQVAEPEMTTALAMTGANVAQNELKLSGKGVKVAVMDTGVDPKHPAFAGRIAESYDFVGDAFNGSNQPVPGGPQRDCNGHGTHVAGIVGGNDASTGFKGVAPAVSFGAYRVFGCAGSTQADIMIAAMERALDDGMQVLNMSIGSAFQTWPEYPTAKAATRLVNKGVAVVASIGNSGASGAFSAGAPGVGDKVIGVASFDNTHVLLNTFTISPDGKGIGYQNASPAPVAPTSGSLFFARTSPTLVANDACAALPANSLTGKVALIRRGTCTFHTKALNAQNAGAAAVVLFNNAPGPFGASVSGTPAITIPVVAISAEEGAIINERLNAGPVELTWTDKQGTFLNATGNLLSSFSSYGLAADLSLKPDIGGPGGLIRSAWPLDLPGGGYNTISGTSMSSPHVAGTVALLLEAKPNTPSQAVRSILQNSANPKPWSGNKNLGFLDFVHRQGAGMVDIVKAVNATARVEPGKLSLGESESGPATRTLTISNNGKSAVTYALSHSPALSTGGLTNSPSAATGFASASFNTPTVTVPAGSTATVDVTITANSGLADKSQYGGYVVFTPAEGSTGSVLRVPYAGLKGDYQSIQVLTPGGNFNFPWLAKLAGTSYTRDTSGATYTLKDGDQPYFLAHFEHQSRLLRAEVYDASGKYLGRAFNIEHLGRSSTATGASAFPFDGTTTKGKQTYEVPSGKYTVKLMVLKALGDESNPAHWETWQSPTFTIAR